MCVPPGVPPGPDNLPDDVGRHVNRRMNSPILGESATPQVPPPVSMSPGHPPIFANPADVPGHYTQTPRGHRDHLPDRTWPPSFEYGSLLQSLVSPPNHDPLQQDTGHAPQTHERGDAGCG